MLPTVYQRLPDIAIKNILITNKNSVLLIVINNKLCNTSSLFSPFILVSNLFYEYFPVSNS